MKVVSIVIEHGMNKRANKTHTHTHTLHGHLSDTWPHFHSKLIATLFERESESKRERERDRERNTG